LVLSGFIEYTNKENLLDEKLSNTLTEQQKKDKVKNTLQYLKAKSIIELNEDKKWVMKN
jgi:hypothetical protein